VNADELGREAAHVTTDGLGAVESGAAQSFRFLEEAAGGWSLRTKLELGVAALFAIAAVLVWALWPAKPVAELDTPIPQVRQADGSVQAQRAPDAQPAPPRHIIPKGFHEERRESVVIAPAPAASSVEVDLSLVTDGIERRVIASSPDGEVIKAIDIPIAPALLPPPPKPWAAGLSYDTRHAVGIWLERDVGRLVVGGALSRLPDGRTEAQVRVGVRF
jgi:hypothetical protein